MASVVASKAMTQPLYGWTSQCDAQLTTTVPFARARPGRWLFMSALKASPFAVAAISGAATTSWPVAIDTACRRCTGRPCSLVFVTKYSRPLAVSMTGVPVMPYSVWMSVQLALTSAGVTAVTVPPR